MRKIVYWTIRIIAIILLAPALILAIPGFFLHILSEELEESSIESMMEEDYKNEL